MTEAISRDRQDNSKKKKFPANFKDLLMHHGSVSDKICSLYSQLCLFDGENRLKSPKTRQTAIAAQRNRKSIIEV